MSSIFALVVTHGQHIAIAAIVLVLLVGVALYVRERNRCDACGMVVKRDFYVESVEPLWDKGLWTIREVRARTCPHCLHTDKDHQFRPARPDEIESFG